MLDPSPMPSEPVPSCFLPHLPRTQTTLSPLSPRDLLRHIALLRQLYLPPFQGCFQLEDGTDLEDDGDDGMRGSAKERRFSAGPSETVDGLGLRLDVGSASMRMRTTGKISEEGEDSVSDGCSSDGEDEALTAHLEPFEREWAERWLNGVVRRAQGYLEEEQGLTDPQDVDPGHFPGQVRDVEAVLRDATAALALMAGMSAAGSLTRHLLFPIDPRLSQALRESNHTRPANPDLSPETTTFLASLSMSPVSPIASFLRRPDPSLSPEALGSERHRRSSTGRSLNSDASTSPDSAFSSSRRGRRLRRRPAIPIILHDAPMADHLGVGVQTWGSAILLGREMALRPAEFGLSPQGFGVRVLELGAGTGLLSILCRKLLDLHHTTRRGGGVSPDLVVATDFHPDVLSNLKVCVDLNFPPHAAGDGSNISIPTDVSMDSGMHIAKLDWTTFPDSMASRYLSLSDGGEEEMDRFTDRPFDLVMASDCVYDPTHAAMIRQVAVWVVRPPTAGGIGDIGGTLHILSPLRPTFAPELESVDLHFSSLSSYPPLPLRESSVSNHSPLPEELRGEGLGRARGLKLGVKGEGKRLIRGRKGEGRADETGGYWWWEIGWG